MNKCYIYSPKSNGQSLQSPYLCIVWLHGGIVNISSDCRLSSLDQFDISEKDFMLGSYNFTPGLQPLTRYLVTNGVDFATITIKGQDERVISENRL
jgi:hypothetical protein